ncbi:MAG: hypothetical protein NVS2B16_06490 [Chloroflexota bacterium]
MEVHDVGSHALEPPGAIAVWLDRHSNFIAEWKGRGARALHLDRALLLATRRTAGTGGKHRYRMATGSEPMAKVVDDRRWTPDPGVIEVGNDAYLHLATG